MADGSPLQASLGTPRRMFSQMRECSQCNGHRRIVSTATGLRRQLFSPSPKRNGKRRSERIPTTGPMRRAGVSMEAGRNEEQRRAKGKRNPGAARFE